MQLWNEIEKDYGLKIRKDEKLDAHSSYKIGGPADYFCEPETVEALTAVLKACREEEIPVCIIGKGSNLLISDKGVRGMVICLAGAFAKQGFLPAVPGADDYPALRAELKKEPLFTADDEAFFFSEAGASLISTSKNISAMGLTGMEFACGIPGTVGGGLYMNAGAYGGSMEQVAMITYYLDQDLQVKAAAGKEQGFAYRTSFFQQEGVVILGSCWKLSKGEQKSINEKVAELSARRRKSQPLEWPSCGSVFKRPEGYYAGKLIMDSGLQGYRVGGAEVSTKHAGFIVNRGGATAADVTAVIRHVRETVLAKYGVYLETEVRLTGEWD